MGEAVILTFFFEKSQANETDWKNVQMCTQLWYLSKDFPQILETPKTKHIYEMKKYYNSFEQFSPFLIIIPKFTF